MSKMKGVKSKRWVVLLSGLLTVGGALAYIPPVGTGWQEWTYYNAAGTAIGGKLYDCNGKTYRWGTTTGYVTMDITNGPCF